MFYIAFLRGINVGGNRKVEMKRLKVLFEQLGLSEASTYINSGNIIFFDKSHSKEQLVQILEKSIQEEFGFFVKVVLRSFAEIKAINAALPNNLVNDSTMKCDVMLLSEETDSPEILSQLIIKEEIDSVKYVKGAILWSVERKNVTRSGMLKLVGTKLYKEMTIRNSNTMRKLLSLLEANSASLKPLLPR